MGAFKIEADRTAKSVLKARVESLEKKVKLLEAVTANLVREVATSEQLKKFLAQPGATVNADTASNSETELNTSSSQETK